MNNASLIEHTYKKAVQGIKEEWLMESSSHWYNYIVELPAHLKTSYLVLILHDQVFNGGFHQYFANGYGQFSKETIDALTEIGATKKALLLKRALDNVNADEDTDVLFRKKLLDKDLKNLFLDDGLFELLNELDTEYYESEDEDLEQLLGNYLSK